VRRRQASKKETQVRQLTTLKPPQGRFTNKKKMRAEASGCRASTKLGARVLKRRGAMRDADVPRKKRRRVNAPCGTATNNSVVSHSRKGQRCETTKGLKKERKGTKALRYEKTKKHGIMSHVVL